MYPQNSKSGATRSRLSNFDGFVDRVPVLHPRLCGHNRISACSANRILCASRIALLVTILIVARTGHAQMLDRNGNGASDLWELVHNAENFTADFDSDGDGVSNCFEATAGTDPRDARSVPRISGYELATNGLQRTFQVMIPGVPGKRYELQSSEMPGANAKNGWIIEGSLVSRASASVIITAPADRPARFFRMSVADVDTDGDGLNDWEEYQFGLDPLSAHSNGQMDNSGVTMNDYRYVTNRLASQSLASLMAGTLAARPRSAEPVCAVAASGGFPIAASVTPTGTGLTGNYYTNASTTYTNAVNFHPTNLFLTRNDAVIDFTWGPAISPNLSNGNHTVRWTGQVQPQYSETYFFETRTDDGVKLWVNDKLLIDRWQIQNSTWTNAITLVADVRYNIRMEYFTRGGSARARLSWFSPSQPRQVIPSNRLYPSEGGYEPGGVTSTLNAYGFVGQPFTYTVTGANSPLSYGASNVPPGLTFNTTNGILDGVPSLAGVFDVSIAVTNAVGVGEAVLRLEIFDTGSSVTREIWSNVLGTSVTNIPLHLPASQTNSLGNLEGITNFGDNYGERIRGYLVAPVTGNYYFWIAANSSAELWISNDKEPANKVRRAFVAYPKVTTPRQWTVQPNQKSAWLALEAGRRYYIEILHKASSGAIDHWSVGWLLDPTGTNTAPSGVVPGYVLAPHVDTLPAEIPGTLYSANMVAQSGALSSGVGSATLRLSADESQAVLRYGHSGLSTPVTAKHIHADTYLGKNPQGQIVFDIDTATPEPDGSYVWQIAPSGTLTAADIVEIIKQGKSYINVHTVNYPAGEINGHFGLAAGTASFTPPPPPPAWVKDHSSSNAAARFLQQATFGASPAEIKTVRAYGYEGWINRQFRLRPSGHLTNVFATASSDPNAAYSGSQTFNTWWKHSVTAPDQLRQRVAFALNQIMVVSESGPLLDNSRALSSYYDTLAKHSFGNFRDLLEAVTLTPGMGIYLDMRRNAKGNLALGTHPNENYAREILQLFSVGLNRMWPDGTLVINSDGDLVPTYDQDVIIGFSHVFTGWNYWQTNQANKRLPVNWNPSANYTNPMVLVPTHHELGTKLLLDNVVLPAAWGTQADPGNTNCDAYCSRDLKLALDNIFKNENVGPFICRQLIQRMVTSHPSRDYLYRVVQKFNDNGKGVRGDMQAVIKAILLDYEARSTNTLSMPTHGKMREPLLRATSIARALPAPLPLKASYKQSGSQAITITSSRPHRLNNGDDVNLYFGTRSGPASRNYNDVTVTGPNTFTVNVSGASFGTYGQAANTITVTNSGHGLTVGQQVYLTFTSGGAASAVYTVVSVVSSSVFTVATSSFAVRAGTCSFGKWSGIGYIQSGTNITFITSAPHGLAVGRYVCVDFLGVGSSTNGSYRVTKVVSPTRFTIVSTASANRIESDSTLFPLVAAPVIRSGGVTVRYSTWNMGYTDGGSSSSLSQTPLNAPTVFNFFFPDYKFQGILASAGLTTPEFQLTSDTSTILQMNFLSGAIFSSGGNTNGLSSFASGNGSIMLDLGPWMTPANTSNAGIPGLVDNLNTLLCSGQLSPASKTIIINYVVGLPFTNPIPTNSQMRDRVRAIVHLITASPEFIVQR
jgi:hypothetical protein